MLLPLANGEPNHYFAASPPNFVRLRFIYHQYAKATVSAAAPCLLQCAKSVRPHLRPFADWFVCLSVVLIGILAECGL